MNYVSYLFSPIPGSVFNYELQVYIYAAALIIFAFIFKILMNFKKKNKALTKTFRSLPSEFIWMGLILIILTASRTSGIPYLSMRFMLYFVLALSFFYIIYNIYRAIKVYPKMKKIVKTKKAKKKSKVYSTKK